MNPFLLGIGLVAGGLFYFVAVWLISRSEYNKMTLSEIRAAQIAEEVRNYEKENIVESFDRKLNSLGYQGNLLPVVLAFTFLYLIQAILFSLIKLNPIVSVLIALPTSALTTLMTFNYLESRKAIIFQKQLLQLVSLVVTSLENGETPVTAFTRASSRVSDPLKKEFSAALNSMITSEDTISSALKPILKKYPSRAFELVMAALEVDEKVGAKLGGPLRQAQKSLEKQFELQSEATAEVSQAKAEFFGITTIIGVIAVLMVTAGGASSRAAYGSTLGILIISILLTSFGLGIYRTLRIFNRAKRGY